MAVHHVCQWGFWGVSQEESCGEADEALHFDASDDDAHETCGWFVFNSVDSEFQGLAESLKGVPDDQ